MSAPPCYGKSSLFDSTLLADHFEAATICAGCDLRPACQRRLEETRTAWDARYGGPEGTWAGQLVIAGKVATDRVVRVALEEAAYSEEDARRAHAAWSKGVRDDWTVAGERTYQRRSERAKRARKRAAA